MSQFVYVVIDTDQQLIGARDNLEAAMELCTTEHDEPGFPLSFSIEYRDTWVCHVENEYRLFRIHKQRAK